MNIRHGVVEEVMDPQFTSKDVPLYMGRLVGLRSFALDFETGKLTGITYPGLWDDGDNAARCALKDNIFYEHSSRRGNSLPLPSTDEDPAEHVVASMDCTCGYYAYFDGNANEYQHGTNIEGIIEVWGKLTLGTKGFRASKSRIAALVVPIGAFPQTESEKLAHRVSCPAPATGPHGWNYPYLAHEAGCSLPLFPYPGQMHQIATNYPSARLFNSMAEALEAFPPTPVDVAHQIVNAQ